MTEQPQCSPETTATTLGEDLPKQMARVRDVLIPQYMSIGPAGGFAIAMMRRSLDRALCIAAGITAAIMIVGFFVGTELAHMRIFHR